MEYLSAIINVRVCRRDASFLFSTNLNNEYCTLFCTPFHGDRYFMKLEAMNGQSSVVANYAKTVGQLPR